MQRARALSLSLSAMDMKQIPSTPAEQSTDHSKIPRISSSPQSAMAMEHKSLTEEQSTEKQSVLGKICLICYGLPDHDQGVFSYGDYGHNNTHFLFLLDLDAESARKSTGDAAYVPRNPNLCFDHFSLGFSGFCVLGSKLYLFGEEKQDVFSYELPSIPTLSYDHSPSTPQPEDVQTLTESMLCDIGCPMNFPKCFPLGCRTPDGKMLVFSSHIEIDKEDSGKFELFHPPTDEERSGGKWEVLPDLLPLLRDAWKRYYTVRQYDNRCVYVCSYSFIDNSHVLLVTTKIGNFALDMDQLPSGWSQVREFLYPLTSRPPFMLVRDGLCLTDWFAWEDGADRFSKLSYPGLSGALRDSIPTRGSAMTWLQPSNNRFCVARAHVDNPTKKPHLIVDVCSFDSNGFQRKEPVGRYVPGLKVMERIRFVMGPQAKERGLYFHPKFLFSIQPRI